MTNVFSPIAPLLALFVALLALGVVVALVSLRDVIPRRFRSSIYVGVVVLLIATAAFVGRGDEPEDGPGKLAALWVAFLALVVLARQLEQWRKETEERKRDARRKIIVGPPPSPMPKSIPAFGRRCAWPCGPPSREISTRR
jgi:peptidoglycan/LPS O-acetylase OafA/YrhL